MSRSLQQRAFRFGPFEVNPQAGELRKQGIHIKLHEKPLQVLLALLEHPGEVVTRKVLQERLWRGDTFVEYENGLNNAISRLREALGDTAGSSRFVETIPRHGYRFLPEVSEAAFASSKNSATKHWFLATVLSLGAALLLGLTLHFALPPSMAIRSLAVLPFRNLGTGKTDDYFAKGMTDAVTTELAKLGVSKVISETSVARFRDTKESVPRIARTLGADAIVEGAVLREGDQIRITVQLVRADTDRHIWADSYERQMTDILALQDDVALGVARAIKLELAPPAPGQRISPKQVNAEGYEAYLKGRYYMQKDSKDALPLAKDYFQQAIQLDPHYAPAYAGLSDYYVLTDALPPFEAVPKAREYAQKALRLDFDLPDSHVSLAYIYFYYDWNWQNADQEFKSAITLAPGLARSHRWYSIYLGAMGRASEAVTEAQRAEDLDPLSVSAHDAAAVASVCNGQYGRSTDEGRKILELDPSDLRGYQVMAIGHFQEGMYQEALQDAEKGLALSKRDPFFLSIAALIYGRLGQMAQAGNLVAEMRRAGRARYVSPFFYATALVGMGKQKEAIDALEEGYKVHDSYMVGLNSTPWFASLLSNPRFQELLRRMKFPEEK